MTVEVLTADAGLKVYVKAANPATNDKAGYEAVFASGALQVVGLVSRSSLGLERSEIRSMGADGVERVAVGGRMVPEVTLVIEHRATDAGRAAMQAALDAGTALAFKFDNSTGLIDYAYGFIRAMPKTEANGSDSNAGYEASLTIGADGFLLNVAAPT